MYEFDVARVAAICQGAVEGTGTDARIRRVVIDSREVAGGDLFVALQGRRSHGHAFVADAFERGAAAVIVATNAAPLPARFSDRAQIRVKYPRKALADLATAHRRSLACPVIAITGSNGKSSTRELIAAAISSLGKVVASPRSYNNDIGLPLTILGADKDTAALVLEMGTSGRGEIRRLCQIARPDTAVVTNVAAAHLKGLGSLAGVAAEKGALPASIPADGLVVLNADDPRCVAMQHRTKARVVTYGLGEGRATVWGSRPDRTRTGTTVWLYGRMRLFMRVIGQHNARGAMAAMAVALSLGVSPEQARDGLRRVRLPPLRLQRKRLAGVPVLLDCYNANPQSLRAAVTELDARADGRRRVLVLGDMRELGPQAQRMHHEAGREVARHVDVLWCLGHEARAAYEGALAAGMSPEHVHWSPDVDTALRDPVVELTKDDLVLFKASRALRLEELATGLQRRREAAARKARRLEKVG